MSGDEKKRDLFGQLKHLVDRAAGVPESPKQPPTGQAPRTAPIGDRQPLTNPLPARNAATDRLQRTAPSTGNLAEHEMPSVPEHELSPRRLAMISDFISGQTKLAEMRDPKYMYKVVSDERAYQVRLLKEMQARRAAAMDAEAIADLEARIATSQAIMQNLFKVLKHLTGKTGKTGGTNYLGDE